MDNDTKDRNVGLPLTSTGKEREKLRLAIDTVEEKRNEYNIADSMKENQDPKKLSFWRKY